MRALLYKGGGNNVQSFVRREFQYPDAMLKIHLETQKGGKK